MSKCLDPDQAQHFVGPDLGPNCLQRLSADDIATSGEKVQERYLVSFWDYFSYFSIKAYIGYTQMFLTVALRLLMSANIVCFYRELKKIIQDSHRKLLVNKSSEQL